jgi:predicted pyridoxine 5'-phosphate oxidase superfamily flavin-nucleotide-binding protein
MAKLTDKMKEVITGQQAWVATTGADGRPGIAIKGSAKILDDEHLAFFELAGNRTWANIQTKFKAFRFEGEAEIITSGPLFEEAKKLAEMLKMPVPPKAAIKVKIEEIYDIGKGGVKVA